jgi:hypothetical protein
VASAAREWGVVADGRAYETVSGIIWLGTSLRDTLSTGVSPPCGEA